MKRRLAAYPILLVLLAACGKNDAPAPETASSPARETAAPAEPTARSADAVAKPASSSGEEARVGGGTHVVAQGETLYGIAKRNGLDHRDLAKWNRIEDPRRLRVGQELRLTPPES